MQKLKTLLLNPADIASLVFFRFFFGLLMVWESYWLSTNWIDDNFIKPGFHFSYYGFSWLNPWPGHGMYFHMIIIGASGLFISIGLFYRFFAFLLFLSFTSFFFMDPSYYLNHFYLVCWISLLMVFIPAHRFISIDVKIWPKIKTDFLPAYWLWFLRFLVALPFFFGGLAKINQDWLHAEPMRIWLTRHSESLFAGSLLQTEAGVTFFSYGGIFFDLLIIPLLLWRKTRIWAFLAALFFNLMNAYIFSIGIFPWLMIVASLLFFNPSWPRKFFKLKKNSSCEAPKKPFPLTPLRILGFGICCILLLFHLLFPFRHFLYPGFVLWNEEGSRFSWQMKLRDKICRGSFRLVNLDQRDYPAIGQGTINARQWKRMKNMPDMILQFSHHLKEEYEKLGFPQMEIYSEILCSLNGRKPQLIIDPTVNLGQIKRTLRHSPWILPLKNPL